MQNTQRAEEGNLLYIQELEQVWWNQYKLQEFASLVPTYRWNETQRNMQPGDVVMISYSSMSKAGTYRTGRVILVEVDKDGLVRTCTVRYRLLPEMPGNRKQAYKVKTKFLRTGV